jgi:thiamine transporter
MRKKGEFAMKNKTVRLTESAIMLALGTILSVLPIFNLPYGGSITVCSALPILVVAYRYGTAWGLFTGAAFGVLQMFLGMNNVMYFTTPLSIAAVILLDYVLAFAALGLGGAFRKRCTTQTAALLSGTLLYSVVRYTLHVLAGCTVWAGLSIPDNAALIYSLAYNATYMLPETIVTLLGVTLISGVLDFNRDTVSRSVKATVGWRKPVTGLIAVCALVYDVVEVFSHLQDPETGDFIITGLQNVAWNRIGLVTGAALILIALVTLLKRPRS